MLLWIFALLDNQLGFVFDLVFAYENIHGKDEFSQIMKKESILCIQQIKRELVLRKFKSIVPICIKDWLKKNLSK